VRYLRNEKARFAKKNTMFVSFIITWLLTIAWFNPRLFSLFAVANTIPNMVVITMFIIFLNIFWLFGSYYLMLFIFTIFRRKDPPLVPLALSEEPKVAILYATMNDFQPEAAKTCLEQNYSKFHLFILDDSSIDDKKREIDRFMETYPKSVTVVRRGVRSGFKAGSINYALRKHIKDYPYFAVIDSDGILPKDFLKKLMPHFGIDESIAFVQGSHRPNPNQKSKFANDLALGIIPLWTVYYGPRNNHGFVIFLGHGGIIRRDVWEEVGGFPEIVSEDLAFSTRIRERGYRGYYVSDVISHEDFPPNYPQLRKQQEKYIRGACEYVDTCLKSFLKSREVTWFEKLDVLMSCATLFVPLLHLAFIILFCFLLTVTFGELKPLTMVIGSRDVHLWDAYLLNANFNSIWTWDFYAITLLNMFAPILGCIGFIISKPIRLLKLLFLSTVPYLSLMVVCTIGVFTYLLVRKASFPITGDILGHDEIDVYTAQGGGWMVNLDRFNSAHLLVQIIELLFGIILTVVCLMTLNLVLLAFSISMVMGFFVLRCGWENRLLKPLMYLPFSIIITAMGFMGFNLLGTQALFLTFFAFHF